jgi:hypothetical protein
MRADRAQVSWDAATEQWLVRIQIGEEVIRRHEKAAKNADEATLRSMAVRLARDEGYELGPESVSIGQVAAG